MTTIQTLDPGTTLGALAARAYGDPTQFRAIADANNLDPLSALPAGADLAVPSMQEIAAQVQPALQQVGLANFESKFGSIQQILGGGGFQAIANSVVGQLPEQLSGYVSQGLAAIGSINGSGDAISTLSGLMGQLPIPREYEGYTVHLVDWLLDGGDS
jgi:hypothetical protein